MHESRTRGPHSPSGAPRSRASDAQRTAVLEALDDSFSAGRLSHFEHFERTRAATKAKYIDELRPLVADLRGGDADLGLGEPDRADAAEEGGDRRSKRGPIVSAGVAIALFAAGAVGAVVSSSDAEPTPPGPLHTLDGLTQMLTSAEAEFGGQDIDTLGIHGDHASLMLEDPAEPGKRLIYVFRGQWQESNFDSHPAETSFHLDDIDPAVVMSAIEAAPTELDMDDDAPTSHVSVYPDALGDPEFVVNVAEAPGEPLGQVTVGVDGEVREVREPR